MSEAEAQAAGGQDNTGATAVAEPAAPATGLGTGTAGTENNDGLGSAPQATTPQAPESYNLTMPEGSKLGETAVADISELAKSMGLSNENAQALLNGRNETLNGFLETEKTQWTAEQAKWADEQRADPEIGGQGGAEYDANLAMANQVISKFGSEKLVADLKRTGMGNYPELVRAFVRIGKAMTAEDDVILGGPSGGKTGPVNPEDVLYPKG